MNKQATPSGVNLVDKQGNQRSDRESNQIGNIEKEHALGYPGKRDTLETWLDMESGQSGRQVNYWSESEFIQVFYFHSLNQTGNVREFGIRIRN